ncbi:hypothetical protein EP331_01945 [bacterium]|nr:MAG: hypothetical protein EP331_01945 [bacterium]
MFSDPNPNQISGWSCVYSTGSDVDAAMVKNYLESCDLDVQILSKRDSAYSLNVGDMAQIFLYVPAENEKEAREVLEQWQSGEAQIEQEDNN